MKALLLGNSPALTHPAIDLSLVHRDRVRVFGANRLWHATNTSRQLILPDYMGTVDVGIDGIEAEWFPPEGMIEGLVVPAGQIQHAAQNGRKCVYAGRKDLIERRQVKYHEIEKPFPERGEAYMDGLVTPALLAQFILEFDDIDQIGLLGIDFTARPTHEAGGKETHWYGHNHRCNRSPTFFGFRSPSYQFWSRFKTHCLRIGMDLRNLSPYPDTPFDAAEIHRMPFTDWIES